jgi:hypothetical protein
MYIYFSHLFSGPFFDWIVDHVVLDHRSCSYSFLCVVVLISIYGVDVAVWIVFAVVLISIYGIDVAVWIVLLSLIASYIIVWYGSNKLTYTIVGLFLVIVHY